MGRFMLMGLAKRYDPKPHGVSATKIIQEAIYDNKEDRKIHLNDFEFIHDLGEKEIVVPVELNDEDVSTLRKISSVYTDVFTPEQYMKILYMKKIEKFMKNSEKTG